MNRFVYAGADECMTIGNPTYVHAYRVGDNATHVPPPLPPGSSSEEEDSMALVATAAGILADLDCSAPFDTADSGDSAGM